MIDLETNRQVMAVTYITPALIFMMKYFFDIEKEITQTLLTSAQLRLWDCRDVVTNLFQVVAADK